MSIFLYSDDLIVLVYCSHLFSMDGGYPLFWWHFIRKNKTHSESPVSEYNLHVFMSHASDYRIRGCPLYEHDSHRTTSSYKMGGNIRKEDQKSGHCSDYCCGRSCYCNSTERLLSCITCTVVFTKLFLVHSMCSFGSDSDVDSKQRLWPLHFYFYLYTYWYISQDKCVNVWIGGFLLYCGSIGKI